MTSSEYERAQKKLSRYGHCYDEEVDKHLPHDLVKTKAGRIAKRQPKYSQRTKTYYQAQCSFRGLRTSGNIDELQQNLKLREKSADARVKQALDQIEGQVSQEDRRKARESEIRREEEHEQWWSDSSRTFGELLRLDPVRAVKEHLEKDGELKRTCQVFMGGSLGLHRAALRNGISYAYVEIPWSCTAGYHIIGQLDAVNNQASKLSAKVAEEGQARAVREEAAKKAEIAAHKAKQDALLAEAMQMEDWDLTGEWEVTSSELATHPQEDQEKLSMEIFRDEFDLTNPREGDDRSFSDDEDDYGSDQDIQPDPRSFTRAANDTPVLKNDPKIPRFCARFDFAIIKGTIRLYPALTSGKVDADFYIKENPTFTLIWRGREIGEGEIQSEADRHTDRVTFSNHGTSFDGTFYCPYNGKLNVRGTKMSHGHGQQRSSKYEWKDLSERQHDIEERRRWGGW